MPQQTLATLKKKRIMLLGNRLRQMSTDGVRLPFLLFFSSAAAPSSAKMMPAWELIPTAVTTILPLPSITWVPATVIIITEWWLTLLHKTRKYCSLRHGNLHLHVKYTNVYNSDHFKCTQLRMWAISLIMEKILSTDNHFPITFLFNLCYAILVLVYYFLLSINPNKSP